MKDKAGNPAKGREGTYIADFLESATPLRRGIMVVLTLVVLLAVLMPELVFHDRIFLVPDTKAPISFSSVGKEALDKGTYPLWNPYIFCGMPSYQSMAYNPYLYPVSLLTHFLRTSLNFPEMTWLLFHYLMAGLGVYLLLRSLDVRATISLLAGCVFIMLPNYLAMGANGHGSQACAVAYMPYALLMAHNIFRGYRRLTMAALLAVVLGFQMLRAHIQISYYTYLLVGLFLVFQGVRLLKQGRRREFLVDCAYLAGAVVVAVGISASLLFPVKAYAQYSIRGGGSAGGLDYSYATGWSLHPREILTFLFPWAFGYGKITYWGSMPFTDFPNYLGVLVVAFSVIGAFLMKNKWKWFLIITAFLSTLLSFGKFFPVLYNPMFKYFPYFNKFRVPVMVLIVQQLVLVVLAGMGVEEYLGRSRRGDLPYWLGGRYTRWYLITGAALLIVVLVGGESLRSSITGSGTIRESLRGQRQWVEMAARSFSGDLIRTVFFFACVAAVLYLVSLKKITGVVMVAVLAAIAFFDLYTATRPVLHPEDTWEMEGFRIIHDVSEREEYKQETEVAAFLNRDRAIFRIFPVPEARLEQWTYSSPHFSDNTFMISRIFSIGGYHAAKLKNYQNVMETMFAEFRQGGFPLDILNMLNVKYFVSRFRMFREDSPFELVWKNDQNFIYRNPEFLPRIFFVDRYRITRPGEELRLMAGEGFHPSNEVLLRKEPPFQPRSSEGSTARIAEYNLNSVVIEAEVEKSCIMVISEIYYPDWKARVDGEEMEMMTANHCLRALPVEPGRHTIRMEFSSDVIRASFTASFISLALVIIVLVYATVINRRRRTGG